MRIYCDTCVYMDLLGKRKDYIRPLEEFSFQLFKRVDNGEFSLIISDHLLFELNNNVEKPEKITELLGPLNKKGRIIQVSKTSEDVIKAKEISKEHWKDALHAILANKAEAVYLLTRNIQHYAGCENLVQIKFPENI